MHAGDTPAGVLSRAVRSVFGRWTALGLAVTHGGAADAGGVADALLADVTTLATSAARRADVDDYLALMGDAFDRLQTDVEDGSPEEVAALVVRLRDAAARGDLAPAAAEIEKGCGDGGGGAGESGARESGAAGKMAEMMDVDSQLEGGGESGEESGEEMHSRPTFVPPPPALPETDADGFTTVVRRRR